MKIRKLIGVNVVVMGMIGLVIGVSTLTIQASGQDSENNSTTTGVVTDKSDSSTKDDTVTNANAKDGQHNIAEFKVDLKKFNLSTMTGQTITMYNPNIGNEKVTVAGGSTGPLVISGVGVIVAGLGYFKFRKSNSMKREQVRTHNK